MRTDKHYGGIQQVLKPALFLLCFLPAAASALTLGEAVGLAVDKDPTYLAAKAGLDVSRERANQALANLLPQVTASASSNSNRRDYTLETARQASTTRESYNSSSIQVNLTQPLLRHANFIALKQANLSTDQSDYQLKAAGQDLLLRLAQAWFEAMQARDETAYSHAQAETARQYWETAKRNTDLGLMSVTDRADGYARYEQAMADEAAAGSSLEIKMAALEQILGSPVATLPAWGKQAPNLPEPGHTLDEWQGKAELGNPSLQAAKCGLKAAEEEISKQRAGHEPTLDLVASRSKTSQGSGLVGGQSGFTSYQDSLGFQLNLPLFSGGMVVAKTGEAIALRNKAQYEHEAALRNARLSTRQAWFTWQAGRERYRSSQQQISAAEQAVKAAEAAKARGIKTLLDVFKARQQEESAKRDNRKALYDMVLSYCKLKAAAGELRGDDLSGLDKWFAAGSPQQAGGTPSAVLSLGRQAMNETGMTGTKGGTP